LMQLRIPSFVRKLRGVWQAWGATSPAVHQTCRADKRLTAGIVVIGEPAPLI
jgi:hypothetical protein